jgi:hypothetical protein
VQGNTTPGTPVNEAFATDATCISWIQFTALLKHLKGFLPNKFHAIHVGQLFNMYSREVDI